MNASSEGSSGAPVQLSPDALGQVEQTTILLGRLAGDLESKRLEPANEKVRLMRSTLLLVDTPAPGLALVVLALQHFVGTATRLLQEDEGVPEHSWDAVSAESEAAISRISQALHRADSIEVFRYVGSLVFAIESLVERMNGVQKAWEENDGIESAPVSERTESLVKRVFESATLDQTLPNKQPGGLFLLSEGLYSAAWLTGSSRLRLVSYLMTEVAGGIARSVHETKWDEGDWQYWSGQILGLMPRLRNDLAAEDSTAVFFTLDRLCLIANHVNFRGILYL